MELTYQSPMMPAAYAVISADEMTYIDGGALQIGSYLIEFHPENLLTAAVNFTVNFAQLMGKAALTAAVGGLLLMHEDGLTLSQSVSYYWDGQNKAGKAATVAVGALAGKLANRFRGRGVEYEELYAAGCVGLVKAVDRFEPERGLCFSTYAVPVILGEIRRLFRDGGSVKISRSLKELSVKAARLRDQLSANGEPRISDIAQALGVTPEEAAEALCAGIPPVSLDHGGEDGEPLPVPSASGEDALIDRLALRQCLSELSGEDREILMLRYFRRKTQSETAQILGMTQVMVSRRERKLLKELREQLV